METIEISLTQEETEAVERYASARGITPEEAFKRALFDCIEEAREALRAELEKELQEAKAGPTRLFEEEIEELRHE